jgi:glycosyltransferase involved in cell wall biosynthesis
VAEDVEQHEAGIVTEVDDNAISEAVVELFQNRDRLRAMGQNANKIANQLYKDERVAHRMLRAFEDVLSNSRNPQCAWQ